MFESSPRANHNVRLGGNCHKRFPRHGIDGDGATSHVKARDHPTHRNLATWNTHPIHVSKSRRLCKTTNAHSLTQYPQNQRTHRQHKSKGDARVACCR
jgi:hypothetical protein